MKVICVVVSHDDWAGEEAVRTAWNMEQAHQIVLDLYNEDCPFSDPYHTFESLMFGEAGHIQVNFHEMDLEGTFCVTLPLGEAPLHRTQHMAIFEVNDILIWPVIYKQGLHEIIKAETTRDVYRLHMYNKKVGDNSPIGDDQ